MALIPTLASCIPEETTAADVHTVATKLPQEDDEAVYGDSAYFGLEKQDEIKQDPQHSTIDFRVNRRPDRLPRILADAIAWEWHIENRKSAVHYKVDTPTRS